MMSKSILNSATDSEGEDDGQAIHLSNRPTTSLEKAHHYFLVALAGDEVKSKLASEEIQKDDVDKVMFQTYSNAVDAYINGVIEEANRFGLVKPEGLSRDVLMATDSRSRSRGSNSGIVSGESLWRKYQELVSYLVNYANPVWDLHMSLGKSRADCLHAVKLQLWEKVETERVERVRASGKSCTPKSFRSTWMPKEWLAFITMGPPAGDFGKKTLCSKSKHAAQITTAAKAVVPHAMDAANLNSNASLSSVTAAATAAIAEVTFLGKRSNSDGHEGSGKKSRSGYDLFADNDASRSLADIVKLKAFELRLHALEKLIAITDDKDLKTEYETLLRDYVENGSF
jgi:hypothetical protein